jgi:type IV pilus assembly protein PilV
MRTRKPRSGQRGILLLESLIAILLISFGVLGLLALWANSIKNASEAKYRTDGAFLANEMIGQLWLGPPPVAGCATPANWTTRLAASLPNGTGSLNCALVNGRMQVTVTVQWTDPNSTVQHTYKAYAQVNDAGPI